MASRHIADLIPEMQEKAKAFAAKMGEANIHFMFTCTRRTQAEQDALYARGRTAPGRIVTWTRKSRHIDGVAFDIAILDKSGKPVWDIKVDVDGDKIPDYQEAGRIGQELGLTWGGSWKTPNYPHFQLDAAA